MIMFLKLTENKGSSSNIAVFFSCYRYFGTFNFHQGHCPGSRAPNFSKLDSYATVPNINIEDCDFTIACWIRVVSRRGIKIRNSIIFSSIGASGNPLSLSLTKYTIRGDISLIVSQMFLSLNYTKVTVALRKRTFKEWTHIAVICQGNDIIMFINGNKERSRKENISFPLTDDFSTDISPDFYKSYYIGKDPRKEFFRSGKFYGSIMDLHVIGVALSEGEISDLFNGESCHLISPCCV